MQIFISYKRKDEEFARRLHSNIVGWGYKVWLDVVDIQAGEDWDTAIHHGLRESSIVVGILTPESLASSNVLDEWGYALSTGKRLFLLWLRDIEELNVPPRYIRLQRIDIRTSEEQGLQRLHSALASESKIVPEHSGQGGGIVEDEAAPEVAKSAKPVVNLSDSAIMRRMTNRQRMLQKVKVFWIDGVLEQSVHGVALIELGIEQDTEKVDNPWETVLKHPTYGDYQLPTSANIADIYYELGNEMLILGDPGSGKTTTLLNLARDMIERAEQDEMQAIPVVFNLSSWADDRKPLAQWLVDELNTKYQVPRPAAKEWVETDALLLLLDGLDEVDKRYRDMCVVAINEFRSEHGFTPLVVCSRIRDYEALSNRLRLNGAIVLQPLNEKQVDHYLNSLGDQMSGVRDAMQNDESLRNLAESPLMLSIMTLAFFGLQEGDLPVLDTVEAQRARLFETYTRRMFERRPPKKHSEPEMLHYLQWLAGRMVERKQSVFYIENLQQDWIDGEWSRSLYRIAGRMGFGMLGGLLMGIVAGLAILLYAMVGPDQILPDDFGLGNIRLVVNTTLGFLLIPAYLGAIIFAIVGIQAFALDIIPDNLTGQPFRSLRRFLWINLIGGLIGLIIAIVSALIFWLILISNIPAIGLADANITMDGIRRNSLTTFSYTLFFSGFGILNGSVSAIVAMIMKTYGAPKVQENNPEVNKTLSGWLAVLIHTLIILFFSAIVAAVAALISKTSGIYGNLYFVLIVSALLTALYAMFVARIARRSQNDLPYFILAGSIGTYIAVSIYIASGDVMALICTGIFIFPVFGLPGTLIGRVSDTIISAEALGWSWRWRWIIVGIIATIITAILLLGLNVYDWMSVNNDYATNQRDIMGGNETFISDHSSTIENYEHLLGDNQSLMDDWQAKSTLTEIANIDAVLRLLEDGTVPSSRYLIMTACGEHVIYRYETLDSQQVELENRRDELITEWNDSFTETAFEDVDVIIPYLVEIQDCEAEISWRERSNIRNNLRYTDRGIRSSFDINLRILVALFLSVIVGGGMVGGLRRTQLIEVRTEPNSGMKRTFFTALRVTLVLGFAGLFIGSTIGLLFMTANTETLEMSLLGWDDYVQEIILPFSAILGLSIGLGLGLLLGGTDALVKHAILRLFLMRTHSIPLNYARMLDSATERILLRKVGGGYIFIHRYLLEYFADQEKINRERKESSG